MRTIRALTLATAVSGLAALLIVRTDDGAVAVRSKSTPSTQLTPPGVRVAFPEPTPTSAASTTPEPTVAARLAPTPPADARDAADPFVLHDDDRWILYSTQAGLINVPVAASADLGAWSAPVDALPHLPAWAEWGYTWAPGVLSRPDGFVLYFAARESASGLQCIGAASSTSSTGPFVSEARTPLVCQRELGGSIDPYPFVDDDGGTTYLLWKSDGNALGGRSYIYIQRLRADGLGLEADAVRLLHNDAVWERPLIENPALVHLGGRYLLLYSGGWWESAGYGTGYATCESPVGPCTKVTTGQPILGSNRDEAGTGGGAVVAGPAGEHWLVYHAWSAAAVGYGKGGARSLRFASIAWDGAALVVRR